MVELIYIIFLGLLIATIIFFIVITMPLPRAIKEKLVHSLTNDNKIYFLIKIHLVICVLAAFFFFDLAQSQSVLTQQKNRLRNVSDSNIGTELRISYLSYTILKIQRNKYITFMVIFSSIALNAFVRLLRKAYLIEEEGQKMFELDLRKKNSDKVDKEMTDSVKSERSLNEKKVE